MNSKMNRIIKLATTIGIVLGVVLFVELFTMMPRYVPEAATVRKVVPNPPWHWMGEVEMTLVRFRDGHTADIAGNRGEPGDEILAPRKRGTTSLLGLLGTRSLIAEARTTSQDTP